MKKFIATTLALLAFVSAYAYDLFENPPQTYLPKQCALVRTPTAACNKGEEPFSKFFARFKASEKFRKERARFDASLFYSPEMLEWADQQLGWDYFFVGRKKLRCDKSYGTFFNVTADEVSYTYDDVLPCDEVGGGSARFMFRRIDGKWYVVYCMLAG